MRERKKGVKNKRYKEQERRKITMQATFESGLMVIESGSKVSKSVC